MTGDVQKKKKLSQKARKELLTGKLRDPLSSVCASLGTVKGRFIAWNRFYVHFGSAITTVRFADSLVTIQTKEGKTRRGASDYLNVKYNAEQSPRTGSRPRFLYFITQPKLRRLAVWNSRETTSKLRRPVNFLLLIFLHQSMNHVAWKALTQEWYLLISIFFFFSKYPTLTKPSSWTKRGRIYSEGVTHAEGIVDEDFSRAVSRGDRTHWLPWADADSGKTLNQSHKSMK